MNAKLDRRDAQRARRRAAAELAESEAPEATPSGVDGETEGELVEAITESLAEGAENLEDDEALAGEEGVAEIEAATPELTAADVPDITDEPDSEPDTEDDGTSEAELVESIEDSLEEGAEELEDQAKLAEPIDPADLPGGENTASDADEEPEPQG
jgi:hypothetical protein